MSRYYFNLVNGEDVVEDPIGIELSPIEVISAVSASLVAEIEAEDPSLIAPWEGWRLQVTDADGSVVAALTIEAAAVG